VANAAPEHQQAAFDFMLKQAQGQGLNVSSLVGTDLSTLAGQAKLDYLNKAAQSDAATGTANLAVAKNTTATLAAQAEARLKGQQGSEIPSKIGLNQAEAAKALADAAKTKQEVGGSGPMGAGAAVTPEMVQNIREGRMELTPMVLRTPFGQQLYKATINGIPGDPTVGQPDPGWSQQRAQIRKAFIIGKNGDNIGALSTAAVHLDDYMQAADAMKNGTFKPGNALYNKIAVTMGATEPVTLEAIKNAVVGEQATALKNSGATDTEIKYVAKPYDSANSPDQFKAAAKASLQVMYQKANTYKERYQQLIPGDTSWSPVMPSAQGVFSKYGIGGSTQPTTSQPNVAPVAPPNYNPQQALIDAKSAIANGAPRDAVLARSKALGHDLTGKL
jgi:hypothetical protein